MVIREASGSPQDAFEPLGLTLNLTFAGSSHRLSLYTGSTRLGCHSPARPRIFHDVPCWGQSGRGTSHLAGGRCWGRGFELGRLTFLGSNAHLGARSSTISWQCRRHWEYDSIPLRERLPSRSLNKPNSYLFSIEQFPMTFRLTFAGGPSWSVKQKIYVNKWTFDPQAASKIRQ